MNTGGLAGNSLAGTPLEPIEALSRASVVSTRVGEVSSVDDNPLAGGSSDASGLHGGQHLQHHGIAPHHSLHQQHGHGGDNHSGTFSQLTHATMNPYQETHKLLDTINKLENEVATVNQDMAYFRHVLDFQNSKIEKLTSLLIDLLHNKDVTQIVNSLQSIQAADPFNVDDAHDSVDDSLSDSVHDSVHDVTSGIQSLSSPSVVTVGVGGVSLDSNMDPQLHQVAQAAVQAQAKSDILQKRLRKRLFSKLDAAGNNHKDSSTNGNNINTAMSSMSNMSNMNSMSITNGSNGNGGSAMADRMSKHHPHIQHQLQQQSQQAGHPLQQLSQHQLSQQHTQHSQQHQQSQRQQSRVQQASQQLQERGSPSRQPSQQHDHQDQQIRDAKRSMSVVDMPGLEVVSMDNRSGRKKPKVTIDFLHNPMTVKEIYDEFTVGFRGQPPLREMDERYGKHEWRGDSRSKESKRFQRRKKLCDAIERGMSKFGKTAEEIQEFIEEFRGDKSLTWVMNGNLPAELMD